MELIDKRTLTDWLEGYLMTALNRAEASSVYHDSDEEEYWAKVDTVDFILEKIQSNEFTVMFKVEVLEDGTIVAKRELS